MLGNIDKNSCCLLNFNVFEKSFRNTIRVSNSLDPDFVRPDLDPNYFHRLSADDTSIRKLIKHNEKSQ